MHTLFTTELRENSEEVVHNIIIGLIAWYILNNKLSLIMREVIEFKFPKHNFFHLFIPIFIFTLIFSFFISVPIFLFPPLFFLLF